MYKTLFKFKGYTYRYLHLVVLLLLCVLLSLLAKNICIPSLTKQNENQWILSWINGVPSYCNIKKMRENWIFFPLCFLLLLLLLYCTARSYKYKYFLKTEASEIDLLVDGCIEFVIKLMNVYTSILCKVFVLFHFNSY